MRPQTRLALRLWIQDGFSVFWEKTWKTLDPVFLLFIKTALFSPLYFFIPAASWLLAFRPGQSLSKRVGFLLILGALAPIFALLCLFWFSHNLFIEPLSLFDQNARFIVLSCLFVSWMFCASFSLGLALRAWRQMDDERLVIDLSAHEGFIPSKTGNWFDEIPTAHEIATDAPGMLNEELRLLFLASFFWGGLCAFICVIWFIDPVSISNHVLRNAPNMPFWLGAQGLHFMILGLTFLSLMIFLVGAFIFKSAPPIFKELTREWGQAKKNILAAADARVAQYLQSPQAAKDEEKTLRNDLRAHARQHQEEPQEPAESSPPRPRPRL